MKMFLAAATAVGLCAFAAPAFAQGLDGSIGYSKVETGNAEFGAVTARLSWTAANIFGVEGEASFGVDDDRVPFTGPPAVMADVELKHSAAIYGTAGIPIGENSRIFGRLGYATQKIEASIPGFTGAGSEEGLSYGVGAQFFFDGKNGIRGDWTKHDFDDAGDSDTWSVSYVRKFN